MLSSSIKLLFLGFIVLLANTLVGESWFDELDDLRKATISQPVICMRDDGGYIALWKESVGATEYSPRKTYHYYRYVNSKGDIVIPKQEIPFWRQEKTGISVIVYSSRSGRWISPDTCLILGSRMIEPMAHPPIYQVECLLVDTTGIAPSEPFVMDGSFDDVLLVDNHKGSIFGIAMGRGLSNYMYYFFQVYPEIQQINGLIPISYSKKYHHSYDWAASMTVDDNFLVCTRPKKLINDPSVKIPVGWSGLPNHILAFVVDYKGMIIGEPTWIDFHTYAMRIMPGLYIGGKYNIKPIKGAGLTLDLTRLHNGMYILSAAGLNAKNDLCLYQFTFDSKGAISEPVEKQLYLPADLLVSTPLQIIKTANATIGRGRQSGNSKYIVKRVNFIYGFDDDGVFYSHRELWDEIEK
jgi:hypothetical protein